MLIRLEVVETFKSQAKPLDTPAWLGVASSSNDPMEFLCFKQRGCFALLLSKYNPALYVGRDPTHSRPERSQGFKQGILNVSKVLTHLFPVS